MISKRTLSFFLAVFLGFFGVMSLAIAKFTVEKTEGFFLNLAVFEVQMPEGGALGDANTFYAEWFLLGLALLVDAFLLFKVGANLNYQSTMAYLICIILVTILIFVVALIRFS